MRRRDMTPDKPIAIGRDQVAEKPAYNEDGVDLTLIRWMLSLTLEQRLQVLQDHANTMLIMKNEITIS